MGFALGWIAVALAGMAGATPAEAGGAPISYTVRMVETQGMAWREGVMTHLKPVTRQGATTVWTMPAHNMTKLVSEAQHDPACRVIDGPRVIAFSGATATIHCRANRDLVTKVSWTGDEIAPEGAAEKVRLGWHTTFVGRKLDQGILVKLVFEDTHIRAVHQVKLNRSVASHCGQCSPSETTPTQACQGATKTFAFVAIPPAGKSPFDAAEVKDGCADDEGCCESPKVDTSAQMVALEVPEIGSQEVAGEWLIPNGELLLLSFGAYTAADKDGKAVVKERLAIIAAEEAVDSGTMPPAAYPPVAGFQPTPLDGPRGVFPTIPPAPEPPTAYGAPIPPAAAPSSPVGPPTAARPTMPPVLPTGKIPLPMPAAPARSLPQGYHSDGSKAALPPLPDDETDADSAGSESSEPLASPQTKKPHKPKPPTDAGTHKTALPEPNPSSADAFGAFLSSQIPSIQFLIPIKSLSIKLPFNQKLDIEIRGRVASEAAADASVTRTNAENVRQPVDVWERIELLDNPFQLSPFWREGGAGR
jgi:hypothetical protein